MVNMVIIGTGDIAHKRHIPAILQAKSGRLYGFCNRNFARTQALAQEYGVKAYRTPEEVYDDPAVQAVLISTPPTAHTALAVQALRAGRYVLLEKPMALTVAEAGQIAAAEQASTARLTMLHVQRYYAPHRKAKELLDAGEIGRLLSVRTCLGNADISLLDGVPHPAWDDALFNVGIHRIDLVRWLVGAEVTGVFGYRSRLLVRPCEEAGHEVDDHAAGILQFDNGVVGTLLASRTSFHGEDRSTTLLGTEGSLITYTNGHDLVLQKRNGERAFFDYPGTQKQGLLELTDLHERFFRSVEDATRPEVTARDGLQSVRIAAALEQADREKRWIRIEEPVD